MTPAFHDWDCIGRAVPGSRVVAVLAVV
ncbi:MAG: hypothetical protein QOC60_239, partial [Frankiaceae bacterium]|nr:hypothetical protein [Frankiaceae bacterium]